MKRLTLLISLLFTISFVNAQTYTFNVRERDSGDKYSLTINTSNHTLSLKKESQNLITLFYFRMSASDNGRIGFAFKKGSEPLFTTTTDDWFVMIKSSSIGIYDTESMIFYTFDPIDTAAYSSVYESVKSLALEHSSEINTPSDNTSANNLQNATRIFTVNGVSFTMIYVKGGSFTMGASSNDSDAYDDEKPAHRVTLSNYYIGQTEVTQGLWQVVMGSNPSYFKGDNHCPVECVSWDDCQEFIRKLNSLTSQNFRLPTEAEWEFAARGGTKSVGYKYSGSNSLDNVAWYDDNSNDKTHPVAIKSSNELGIYDMSGNVWEWCQDWYDGEYYRSSPSTDPKGPSSGSSRVLRGGSWRFNSWFCRVSRRDFGNPDNRSVNVGFRLAL